MSARRFHCSLSPVCTAPRLGCVCPACSIVRRGGVANEEDAEDVAALTRAQRGHPRPQLPPSPVSALRFPVSR